MLELDKYPMHGLGFCKSESAEQFSSYKWSGWTRQEVQPMEVDQGLMDMLRSPGQGSAGSSASAQPSVANQDVEMSELDNKGSKEPAATSDARPEDPMVIANKDLQGPAIR